MIVIFCISCFTILYADCQLWPLFWTSSETCFSQIRNKNANVASSASECHNSQQTYSQKHDSSFHLSTPWTLISTQFTTHVSPSSISWRHGCVSNHQFLQQTTTRVGCQPTYNLGVSLHDFLFDLPQPSGQCMYQRFNIVVSALCVPIHSHHILAQFPLICLHSLSGTNWLFTLM